MKTKHNLIQTGLLAATVSLAVWAVWTPGRASAQVYDAVANFSTNSNPNGVWSYGWATSAGGPFQLMTTLSAYGTIAGYNNGLSLPDTCAVDYGFGGGVTNGTVVWLPDTLHMDPQSYAAIVRFTASTNGTYQIQGLFRLQDTNTKAHYLNILLRTNIAVYYFNTTGGQLNSEYPYSFQLNLLQGDTLDFVVSCESGQYGNLATGLKATVTLVTNTINPSSFDAVADFSTNANPNGVWSYLFRTNLSSPVQILFTNNFPTSSHPEVFAWWNGIPYPPTPQAVTVTGNEGTNPVSETVFPNVIYYTDTINEDPESYVVSVRFTTPSNGLYSIQGFYRVQDTQLSVNQTGSGQYNGAPLQINVGTNTVYTNNTYPGVFLSRFPFAFTNFLNQGTTVDFMVVGNANLWTHLSTGLSARITPLPFIIQPPLLAGTNFAFSFSTISNQSYTVQQNMNLATTNWIFYTNFIGNGSLYQFLAPVSSTRQQFFRVSAP